LACTCSGGRPLGSTSFTLTLCHLPSREKAFGAVSEHILVSELNANLCGDTFQVVWVVDRERAAACEFRDILQQLGTQTFLFSRKIVVICTDGLDHYVCFLYQVLDLALCVSAAIVTSVRDDQ
jgi:hypothetical protein